MGRAPAGPLAAASRRGFSLIELVAVITITGIICAIALPRFGRSIQRSRLDAAARRVATDLNMARDRANMTSSPLAVTFTLATSTYQIPGVADLDRPLNPYTVKLAEEPYRAAIASTSFGGIVQTRGTTQVTFGAFGLPSTSGSITVSVGSATRIIIVDSASGKAVVQ